MLKFDAFGEGLGVIDLLFLGGEVEGGLLDKFESEFVANEVGRDISPIFR